MIRLILSILVFLAALLCVFPIPSHYVWYLAIAVTAYPWVGMLVVLLLCLWAGFMRRYRGLTLAFSGIAFLLFLVPVVQAYKAGYSLDARLDSAFGEKAVSFSGVYRATPFSFWRMMFGNRVEQSAYKTFQYAPGGAEHSLHFFPSQVQGIRPCLVVVHGGSWKSGNNTELEDVDRYFAAAGYQVASINYRLADLAKFPAPQEDVHAAFDWLRANASVLKIDTAAFILLGRSAGGQIVLNAAYSLHEPGLRGVVSLYGPTDMVFGYNDPHNQSVMKNRAVLEYFFGGTPAEVPQQYANGSPMNHVDAQSVPTLLIHGNLDQHVHFSESARLDEKLQSLGVAHLLLALPWSGHGCDFALNGPSGQLIVYAEERFMKKVTSK